MVAQSVEETRAAGGRMEPILSMGGDPRMSAAHAVRLIAGLCPLGALIWPAQSVWTCGHCPRKLEQCGLPGCLNLAKASSAMRRVLAKRRAAAAYPQQHAQFVLLVA